MNRVVHYANVISQDRISGQHDIMVAMPLFSELDIELSFDT